MESPKTRGRKVSPLASSLSEREGCDLTYFVAVLKSERGRSSTLTHWEQQQEWMEVLSQSVGEYSLETNKENFTRTMETGPLANESMLPIDHPFTLVAHYVIPEQEIIPECLKKGPDPYPTQLPAEPLYHEDLARCCQVNLNSQCQPQLIMFHY